MVPFGHPMQIASDAPETFRSSARRPSSLELLRSAVNDILSRRRLIQYLVRAEIKKQGTDTVLGNIWWVLDPLISLLVYVFVMQVVFARDQPDFGLFLLSAMIPFKWFTGTVSESTSSVIAQGLLIKQIQFPKIVLPVVTNGAGLVNLGFGMIVLGVVLILNYRDHLTVLVLVVPFIAAIQFVFMLALSMFLSALTVFYRDVGIVVGHLLRLLFYVAPILWTFNTANGRGEILHEKLGDQGFEILRYNPIAVLSEAYRTAIYGRPSLNGKDWHPGTLAGIDIPGLLWVLGFSVVLLILGTIVFKRVEPAFAKVL